MSRDEAGMKVKPSVSKAKRELIINKTKLLVSRLTDYQILKGRPAQLSELEISNICVLLNEIFMEEPSCLSLKLDDQLYIVGDTYGHYTHLLQILNGLGHPPARSYLFLGNYVNRGDKSIETITLLFAYKLLYPCNIYLLRGNHECEQLGREYGFYAECSRRFSPRLWAVLMDTFNYLPAAAVIENIVFCSHSGISPSIIYSGHTGAKALQDYISVWIPRPTVIETSLLLTHLTWSEPDIQVSQWERNPAGLGYLFGPAAVDQFCNQFGIYHIVRSNEMIPSGYQFFSGSNKLVTIFSAPDYLGIYRNLGAVMQLNRTERSESVGCQIKQLKPTVSIRGKIPSGATLVIEGRKSLQRTNSTFTAYEEVSE
ncbi:hypothetical protein AHF37_10772 [Paragonimus kellicotti]|nr:hypothetical protein AHF37_10772 [Paragonimus kellicotti]